MSAFLSAFFCPRGGVAAVAVVLALASCETTEPSGGGGDGERHEVTAETTPFYRLGPQQDSGPDMQLAKGTRLTLVKRGFGYSNVELDNGWPGWVATSDIGPASADPEAAGNFLLSDNIEGNSAIVGRFASDVPLPADFEPADLPDPDTAFPETPLLNPGTPPQDMPEFRY